MEFATASLLTVSGASNRPSSRRQPQDPKTFDIVAEIEMEAEDAASNSCSNPELALNRLVHAFAAGW